MIDYKKFSSIFLIFVLLIFFDLLWFSYSVPSIYSPLFARSQNISIDSLNYRMYFGLIAWLFLALGIHIFIKPFYNIDSLKTFLFKTFSLGVVIYGTFNFTNLTVFSNYTLLPSIIDTLWGGIVISLVSLVIKFFSSFFN